MAIQSPEELFSLIEKSNLLDAEQTLAARQSVEGLDDATLAARKLARDGILTRWQAAQLLAGRSSFLLGKYKLIDLLGRGGMGRVFLGRHVTMQRQVALKIVAREVGSNPAALERFLAEARAIAALDHPAIVQAYSVDCEGDRYYIVMEYVDGRDLQRVVEEDGPLDCPTAIEYMRQAADGLAHAHGRDLVHCDIKPSNLLVNRQGQVKILDMGMARLGGGDAERDGPEGNHILGSVDYLAPEQALGTENFDHRADIYSLGCTLYFLLTGHPPFPEGTLPQRILKHQTQQPRPIPTERPDVSPPLVQVCRRMMAKRPEDRYQSAGEILAALTEMSTETGEPAGTEGMAWAGLALTAPSAGGSTSGGKKAKVSDSSAPIRQWLASTSGRLALGGAALLALVLVAGVSLAIVAATSSPSHREVPGEVVTAPRPDPVTRGKKGEEEGQGKQSEEEEEKERTENKFDLERAFARRQQVDDGELTAKPPGERQDAPPEQPTPEPEHPEQPAAEREKPEEPKSEKPAPDKQPKPPEKATPQNPLRDVGKSIALADGARPGAITSVGKLYLPEGAALQMELFGGRTALRGNRRFLIEGEKPEGGASRWWIKLQSEPPGYPTTVVDVARLGVAEEEELRVEWLPPATVEMIQALRNCALAVRVGEETAWVGFGEPEPAEPLVLDFAKRNWRATLLSDAFPETESLRIELTRIDGKVPKLQFKPANTVKEGERMEIELAKPDTAVVKLQFSFTIRGRALRVEAVPMFSLADIGQWPLTPRDTQRVGSQLVIQQSRLDLMLKATPEKHENRKKLTQEKARIDKAVAHLKGLAELYEDLHERAAIHYRVFTLAGERQIDLWSTDVEAVDAATAGRTIPPEGRLGTTAPPWAARFTHLIYRGD